MRVALLCVCLVTAGSPWAREVLLDAWAAQGDGGAAMVYRALFAQGWEPSPESDPYMRVADLRGNVTFLVLLAGVVLLVPRLVGRAPAARGVRLAAAVGTGVLVSLVAAVVAWAVVVFTDPAAALVFGRDTGDAFVLFAVDGLVFGTLLGALTALVHAGAPPGAGRRAARAQAGGTAAADDVPAAGNAAAPVATGGDPEDATRYLCAAAYTDPAFARRVVDRVLGDRLGAVAVSPGVDLVPVARHSLTALRLRRERDRRLAAAYGVIVLFGPLWLLFARLVPSLLASVSTVPVAYPAVRGRHLPRPSAWRLAAMGAGLLVTGVVAGAVLSAVPLPGFVRWLVGGYWYGVPPLLAVAVGAGLAVRTLLDEEADVDARMRGALRRGAFDPEGLPRPGAVEPWAAARIAAVADAQRGNVRCYSGFSPFVGYGRRESEWTLSVPLLPAESERAVADFDAWDLLARLRRRLAEAAGGLPAPTGPGARGGVEPTVEDRVFVSGRELAGDDRFLPDPLRPPVTRLPEEAVRQIALRPGGAARHYLASHVPLWGGEVVPSHLLHVAVADGTLHLRCERYVLGPVRRDLHAVDLLPPAPPAAPDRRTLLPGALRRTGGALWRAPRSCLRDALAEYRRPRRLRSETRAAREDPAFDRGARLSVRETVQGPEYFHHFQPVDARHALDALDRHALAAVRDFLEEHGVDTADFRTQSQTILNHGVLQTGGVSVVGNQAVGAGARATAATATATTGGTGPSGGASGR
ncbi:hypothetical protein LUX05_23890 [Streptomyces somaliensis]|uniref:hypothetical protein n=1 Tax=Streptomyces somaliensis TaxID=78355 RepID=UPI0034E936B2|nr:hypothetical protein [Streptomyces somaliensis]MCP9972888.1 hypothetical protein [Streptomyces somaliensis]